MRFSGVQKSKKIVRAPRVDLARKAPFRGDQIAKMGVKPPQFALARKVRFGFRSKMLYLCTTEEKTMRFSPFFGSKMAKTTFDVVKTSSKVVKTRSDVVFRTSDVVKISPDLGSKTVLVAATTKNFEKK